MTENHYIRPSWDEYFMEVAHTISKRATCDRGRSGCVIAKDKQILVTGYVGSPRGLPHCDEVGHLMKKVLHEDDPPDISLEGNEVSQVADPTAVLVA